ncbi:hypothetical protein [Gordonia malaquae]|uniref:hypothetical protein n=1 Tax=Gordonia malaquae TaxID=410332 RepID=UPI0030FE575F
MTDQHRDIVQRARAALDGITPGEWVAHHFRHQKTGEWVGSDVTPVAEACGNGDGGICTSEDDAKFIAASPRLVRELLAENERLNGENRRLRFDMRRAMKSLRELIVENERLRRDNPDDCCAARGDKP